MSQELTSTAPRHASFTRRRRAMLPHLGNLLLGNLYHALAGRPSMPKVLFKRAVAHGLRAQQLQTVGKQVEARCDLPKTLAAIGDDHLQRGLYWQDLAVKTRAKDHFLEASFWHMYAGMFSETLSVSSKSLSLCRTTYLQAAPHFQNPAEPVVITYLGGAVNGYLRLPTRQVEGTEQEQSFLPTNYSCVVLFNGLNAPKEELHLTENALLATGIATLSFDYPGTSANSFGPEIFGLDIDELASSLLVFLASRPEIDISRLALLGTSLGGRLALYVAAKFPERFRAVATLSAPLDLLTDLYLLLPAMQREMAATPSFSKAAVLDLSIKTPVRAMLPDMITPVLAVGGSQDVIALPEETRLIYDECGSTDKKLIICAGAGHSCHEMMPSLRHEIAQWIRQRL